MKVLVVDDHALFREGLTAILNSLENVEVVGAASDGAQAAELASQLRPNVVLIDLHMPTMNGVEATRTITSSQPELGISVGAALAVLRAHAYAESCGLPEVATQVTDHRLQLGPLYG